MPAPSRVASRLSPTGACLGLITILSLLLVTSFKCVQVHGAIFTASSLLTPVLTWLYWRVLVSFTPETQRHVLNVSLMGLYLFSIGLYVVLNLPAAEALRDPLAHQIVFEDVPRQFFATTVAFGLGCYLPGLFLTRLQALEGVRPEVKLLSALIGGAAFFALNFISLFSELHEALSAALFPISAAVVGVLLLVGGFCTRQCLRRTRYSPRRLTPRAIPRLYLEGFAASLLLVCFIGEYRLVAFGAGGIMPASIVLLPFILFATNLIHERWGESANRHMVFYLVAVIVWFGSAVLMLIAMPSPMHDTADSLYITVMPRRIPVSIVAFGILFYVNARLLAVLRRLPRFGQPWSRILLANALAALFAGVVNHYLLTPAIFSDAQMHQLSRDSLTYLMLMGLPCLLVLCAVFHLTQQKYRG
ncbi:VUT family protein [Legionella geestiana]|nr:VUT family protein [Legionella geestiana]QBS12428.1 VUT family protein [Legionella geestiana]QDQ39858.1 VUT family protein [Legionella geestiana]STX55131.1 Uncharacterized ACR, YhhQ family COG1738 [Legionella geestiana]